MQLRCSEWRPCGCMHCNGGLHWEARHHSRRHGGAPQWDFGPFSLLHWSALPGVPVPKASHHAWPVLSYNILAE